MKMNGYSIWSGKKLNQKNIDKENWGSMEVELQNHLLEKPKSRLLEPVTVYV
jgi:hypothetical protein